MTRPGPDYVQYAPGPVVPAGQRMVGTQFRMVGVFGDTYASPDYSLEATGSNGTVYQPTCAGCGGNVMAGRPTFPGVDIHAGENSSGWVAWLLPSGVTLVSVRYQAMSTTQDTVSWTTAR